MTRFRLHGGTINCAVSPPGWVAVTTSAPAHKVATTPDVGTPGQRAAGRDLERVRAAGAGFRILSPEDLSLLYPADLTWIEWGVG